MSTISTPSSSTMSGIGSEIPITHIVLFKYCPSIPWPILQAHFDTFLALKTNCVKPFTNAADGKVGREEYMVSMKMGGNGSWEGLDKGFTHAFVLEFKSQEDLDYYLLEDEVHREFTRGVGEAGLVLDSLVVDIKDGMLFGPKPKKPSGRGGLFEGSCHCEEVRWTARLEKAEHILCHCDTCKKLGGGPYSLNQIIGRNDLTITQGHPSTYTYTGASGKSVNCYFCARCTSHVYHHQEVMGDQIIVRTILLSGGKDMAPAGEIFEEGRLGWVKEMQESLKN